MPVIKHHHVHDAITYTAHVFRESKKTGHLRLVGAELQVKISSLKERFWYVYCQRVLDWHKPSAMNCQVRVDLLESGVYKDDPSYYPFIDYNGILSVIKICDHYLINRQEIISAQLVDTLFMEEASHFKWWYAEYLCAATDGTLFTQGIHVDTDTGMLFDLTETVKRKSFRAARSE